MQDIPLEKLLEKTDGVYKLVVLASRRALQLNEGAPRLVETRENQKIPSTALKEILDNKVAYKKIK